MKPDYDSLINAGLSKEEIAKFQDVKIKECRSGCCENIGTNCLMRYMKSSSHLMQSII